MYNIIYSIQSQTSLQEEKIKQIEKMKLEKELTEGYTANSDLDRATCDDFRFVDGENI